MFLSRVRLSYYNRFLWPQYARRLSRSPHQEFAEREFIIEEFLGELGPDCGGGGEALPQPGVYDDVAGSD